MPPEARSRSGTTPLAIADGLSLLVFTVVGLLMHGARLTPTSVLRDVVPLLGTWYLVATLAGVYRRPGWATLLLNWVLAVPAGVLLRQLWVGRLVSRATVVFLIAAMALTLVFLLVGRVLMRLVPGRDPSRRTL